MLFVTLALSLIITPATAAVLWIWARWFNLRGGYKQALLVELLQYAVTLAGALLWLLLVQDIVMLTALSLLTSIAGFVYFARRYYRISFKKSLLLFVGLQLTLAIVGAICTVLIRTFIFMPFYVSGTSMEPTFQKDDYLLVQRFDHNYHRGDIIVFADKAVSGQFFIKRIIGLPGETVTLKKSGIIISTAADKAGFKLDEPYLGGKLPTVAASQNVFPVKAGQYFVLGDNRAASEDSRDYGVVTGEQIIGKYWFKIDLSN